MFGKGRSDTKAELWKDFENEALAFLADLFRLAVSLTRSRDEAEDLVQETLTAALKSFRRYQRGTNCRAWLAAIMYRLNLKRIGVARRMRIVDEWYFDNSPGLIMRGECAGDRGGQSNFGCNLQGRSPVFLQRDRKH